MELQRHDRQITNEPHGDCAARPSWAPTPASRLRFLSVVALALLGLAFGQSTWQVDVLIPDAVSVRVPTTQISFQVDLDNYPPNAFPARYAGSTSAGDTLPVQVFSNATGPWSLLLQVPDLLGAEGQGAITADQVLFRVDGGSWQRASSAPQVIFTGSGPTTDWVTIDVEFEVELTGREAAGSFDVNAYLTASIASDSP